MAISTSLGRQCASVHSYPNPYSPEIDSSQTCWRASGKTTCSADTTDIRHLDLLVPIVADGRKVRWLAENRWCQFLFEFRLQATNESATAPQQPCQLVLLLLRLYNHNGGYNLNSNN